VIERFYRKIFIAIVQDGGEYQVRIVAQKKKQFLYTKERSFDGEFALRDMNTYIQKYTEETPLHYIALLNPTPKQGALNGCSHHSIEDMEELSGAKTLCRENKWLLYTSLRELDVLQEEYKKIGLDFIFSPFSVIEHFFRSEERRVGKECRRLCRSRWSPYH
jgi:hypothetical protein